MTSSETSDFSDESALGCYGLRLRGVAGAAGFLSPMPAAEPLLTVRRSTTAITSPECFTDTLVVLPLAGGHGVVRLDRASLTAEFSIADDYPDEAILHPFMSGSAAIANRWLGRDTFHAGAFLTDQGAWCLIGDKGQGKSSTLGYLAAQGIPILTDDLLITEDGQAFAGPAFVDLRPDAAGMLGLGRDMGVLGARSRFRLDVAPAPVKVAIAGWIILAWGDSHDAVELRDVPIAQRLQLLFDNRAVWRDPPQPASFLAHAALPMWELRRPKDWAVFPEVLELFARKLTNSGELDVVRSSAETSIAQG